MNRKEIYGKGYTYIVTRRNVTRGGVSYLRVRVRVYKGFSRSSPVWNEFKDYGPGEWAYGDAAFGKHIEKIQRHVS